MKPRTLTYALVPICGAIAAALAVYLVAGRKPGSVPVNIIPEHGWITQEDYWDFLDRRRFDHPDPASLFEKSAAGKHTIPFFIFLNEKYKDLPPAEQAGSVRAHMERILAPPEKAARMFEIYRAYSDYQQEMMRDAGRWFSHRAPEMLLVSLRDLQEFRRSRFGRETADALFGVEVKSLEYTLRKHAIITGKRNGGAEKERILARLRAGMWGDQAETVDSRQTPAQRCEEKINIYENEFRGLDETERLEEIRRIRLEFFPPEEADRMEAADRRAGVARRRDRDYYRRSRPILEARDLTEAEKNERLMNLQNEIYGAPGDSVHP